VFKNQADAVECGHGRGELLGVLDEMGEAGPGFGLARDDALHERARLCFQAHEEMFVGADRGQRLGEVVVGFDGLSDKQQAVARVAKERADGHKVVLGPGSITLSADAVASARSITVRRTRPRRMRRSLSEAEAVARALQTSAHSFDRVVQSARRRSLSVSSPA